MALVLAERDYKLITMFTKIIGIFTFAAGSVMIVDHQQYLLGIGLLLLGVVVTMAPVPMTVVRPDTLDDDPDLLTVDE